MTKNKTLRTPIKKERKKKIKNTHLKKKKKIKDKNDDSWYVFWLYMYIYRISKIRKKNSQS